MMMMITFTGRHGPYNRAVYVSLNTNANPNPNHNPNSKWA